MEFLLQDLNNTSIIVVAIAFLILFHYVSHKNKSWKQKSPPEAGGAWPILGHHYLFRGSKLPHVALGDMADKYGPIFTIRIGVHKVLVISDWKLAKELSTSHDVHISSRPKFRAAQHLGYNYLMVSFAPYGPYWREMRKLTSSELLSNRRIEQLKYIRVAEIETSVKELYKVWTENKNSDHSVHSGRVLVEMKKWFGDLTFNVFLQMVAGERFFGTAGDEKQGRRCQRVLRDFFHFLGVFVPADALPFLGWLDIGGHEKVMKKVAEEMDSLVEEWLQEHRRKKEAAGDGFMDGGEEDFMDTMLSRIEGIDLNGCSGDTVIKAICMNMMAGGADSVLIMLTWALSLMMNNPHVLKKAQEELDMVVGKERKVDESDINNLVYLQVIVKETFRIYPGAPLGGPRIFANDCTVSGFHVPKDTWLFINVWKLQRDPLVWSNPLEFKPERFINHHKDLDVLGQDFELIPFGAADALPFLGWLDIGGYEKTMKEVAKEMDSLVEEWLQEHHWKKEATDDGSTVRGSKEDFMDVMLSRIEGIDLNGFGADSVIKSTCMNLIAGGADTTSIMLTWALSLMMNNPHVLNMAQEELDIVVGKERKVNESDIKNLVYLQAIVKETFRMYPGAPLGGPRMFTKDCIISGFHVPKDTWLFFNLWKLQRDPQVWSSPHEFKPERFINSHKDLDVLGQDFELIPFGAGRRICPGITFGLQMVHLVLANLLHSFELSNVSSEGIDMTETAGLTNLKATPLEILIVPRLSPNLY
nr:cytochrome P450 CYP82D47-like [Ipomoea batatas]